MRNRTLSHKGTIYALFFFIVCYILQISVQYFFREIMNFPNFEKILISIIAEKMLH